MRSTQRNDLILLADELMQSRGAIAINTTTNTHYKYNNNEIVTNRSQDQSIALSIDIHMLSHASHLLLSLNERWRHTYIRQAVFDLTQLTEIACNYTPPILLSLSLSITLCTDQSVMTRWRSFASVVHALWINMALSQQPCPACCRALNPNLESRSQSRDSNSDTTWVYSYSYSYSYR